MISVKISLAFVITFVLAIIAFFVASSELLANMSAIVSSSFVVLTTLSLLVVSSIQSSVVSSTNKETTPVVAKVVAKKNTHSDSVVPNNNDTDIATLYVGNLAYKANEQLVQEYFETVGTVKSVRLVKDKRTGRRKGFGFIEVNTSDESTFISKLNESDFMERSIIVRPANEKQH